jgi:hypothetical protein
MGHCPVYQGGPIKDKELHMKTLNAVLLAAVSIGMLWAQSASADTITVSAGSFRTTYSGSRTMSLTKFNPSLGTLNFVSIEFLPVISGTVSGYGTGSANESNGWAYEFSGSTALSGPGFSPISRSFFFSGSGLVYQPGAPVFVAVGPATLTDTPLTLTSNLAGFIGSGTFSTTLSASYYTDLFFSRGGTESSVRELGATVNVTYDYTPVPEPASLGLLAVGGLMLLRRRKTL